MDDDRVPVLIRLRRVLIPVLVGLVAACARPALPSTPPAPTATTVGTPSPGVVASPGGPSVEPSAPAASPSPIPDVVPVERLPLETVTLVCERWGGEPPPRVIDCGKAAALALAAAGPPTAASVGRIDVGFGDWCNDLSRPCPNRTPIAGWVLLRTAAAGAVVVRIAVDAVAGLRAWPAVSEAAPAPPTFAPPRPAAPIVSADAPSVVRDREPLPFCGEEDVRGADDFDVAMRTCFLTGVLAGKPVELISRASSTEGGDVVTLYRFAGQGPVQRFVGDRGRWTASICGISAVATTVVFLPAGDCQRLRI